MYNNDNNNLITYILIVLFTCICSTQRSTAKSKFTTETGLEINARPLAQASIKTVGQVQVTDHSPGLESTMVISRIYYNSKY